jgi:hypothetical protein
MEECAKDAWAGNENPRFRSKSEEILCLFCPVGNGRTAINSQKLQKNDEILLRDVTQTCLFTKKQQKNGRFDHFSTCKS